VQRPRLPRVVVDGAVAALQRHLRPRGHHAPHRHLRQVRVRYLRHVRRALFVSGAP
jgi:hypothetical protein